MSVDLLFTDGVIAVKEKNLLKDKIFRMCELSADEAFRMLLESSFGGVEVQSVFDYEQLVSADERDIDEFIREYAPSNCVKAYLLCGRDFHNAKAAVKGVKLGEAINSMLAPDGLLPAQDIVSAVKSSDFSRLAGEEGQAIVEAINCAQSYFEGGGSSGAEVSVIFDRAQYAYLSKICKRNKLLSSLVATYIDMTNILTALRAKDEKKASSGYIAGGRLNNSQLSYVFAGQENALAGNSLQGFYKLALSEKVSGKPLSQAEKMRDSYAQDFLSANRFELKNSQPFLYYVFRRRAQNANVRIVFACLLSKLPEKQIKMRLRATEM